MTNTTRHIYAACLRCGQKVPQGAWTIETAQAVLEGARPAFVCPDCGIFEPSSAKRESPALGGRRAAPSDHDRVGPSRVRPSGHRNTLGQFLKTALNELRPLKGSSLLVCWPVPQPHA